jgi:prolyl oligopeptidase
MQTPSIGGSSGSAVSALAAAANQSDLHTRAPKKTSASDLAACSKAHEDPHEWLEANSPRTRAWVAQQNQETKVSLKSSPDFEAKRQAALRILFDKEILPRVSPLGNQLCTVWINKENPHGDVRGVDIGPEPHPFEAYKNSHPDTWESILRIADVREAEGINWAWAGAKWLQPHAERAMIAFSEGGKDAKIIREYDAKNKKFVIGKKSFNITKPGFSVVDWYGKDKLIVQTDMGPGSLTLSGQPRFVAVWNRGQALSEAKIIFKAQVDDVKTLVDLDQTPGFERLVVGRQITNGRSEVFLHKDDGKLEKMDIPSNAKFRFWRDQLLLELRSDFKDGGKTFESGSLIATCADSFLNGQEHQWQVLFKPTAKTALADYELVGDRAMVLNINDQVVSRLEEGVRDELGEWVFSPKEGLAPNSSFEISHLYNPLRSKLCNPLSNRYFIEVQGFLMSTTLMAAKVGCAEKPEVLKTKPTWFDTDSMRVDQYFATSKDGTQVPYFVVQPRMAELNGKNPTVLDGYGGFSVSLTPVFDSVMGKLWLDQGGIYVQSNIRGGGEFGPSWHQAGSEGNRQNGFDDHIAVAEDLITRGITSPAYLGLNGGSLGGLLVAAVMEQRPELFKAVCCANPVLDMQRYTKLGIGHSRISEYGDPDKPEDWDFLSQFSPYHNIPSADVQLPSLLLMTSDDDRVAPGHARKMKARMEEKGHDRVHFYEADTGGHKPFIVSYLL